MTKVHGANLVEIEEVLSLAYDWKYTHDKCAPDHQTNLRDGNSVDSNLREAADRPWSYSNSSTSLAVSHCLKGGHLASSPPFLVDKIAAPEQ